MDFHSLSMGFLRFSKIFTDIFGFVSIYMKFYGFAWIYIDFHGFPWFFMDLKGSGTRMSGILKTPVPACRNGLDPPNIKISDSGGLDLPVPPVVPSFASRRRRSISHSAFSAAS